MYCHPLVFKPLPSVLFRNDGKGRFTDVTARVGLGPFRGNGLGVVVSDYDDDEWPDVFVSNDGVHVRLDDQEIPRASRTERDV